MSWSTKAGTVVLAALLALSMTACEEIADPIDPDAQDVRLDRPATTPGANVVTQTNRGRAGWFFVKETGDPVGSLVEGPGDPPLREGSARFELDSDDDGLALANSTPRFRGIPLDDIDELRYCTYVEDRPDGRVTAVSLQLNADADLSNETSEFGRLVFEPANNTDQGATQEDTWQCWDALNDGQAQWWGTSAFSSDCPNAAPFCTWNDVLATFPDAGLHPDFGGPLLKAGSGFGSDFDGNADALTIVIDGAQLRYDFEASPSRASGNSP